MLKNIKSLPLLESKFPCHITSLILNKIRHKVWTQPDVGATITTNLIVVGCREECKYLYIKHDRDVSGDFLL